MTTLTPVDHDPFAQDAGSQNAPAFKLTPVDHDPFANAAPQEAPKEYRGFTYVPGAEDQRAHYEGANGQWVLPEDISKAAAERDVLIGQRAKSEYEREGGLMHVARSGVQGGMLGWEPKLAGVISGGGQETEDVERAKSEKFATEHPGWNFIGGGVGGAMALGPVAGKAASALQAARPALAASLGWGGRAAATGAVVGAPAGAISELAEPDATASSVAGAAGAGAVTGAALGAATEGLVRQGARAASWLGNTASRLVNSEKGAVAKIGKQIEKTGLTPQEIADRIVPQPTPELAAEGVTQEGAADILTRVRKGDAIADIAATHNVAPEDVQAYLQKNPNAAAIPTNIVDAAGIAAAEKGQAGAETPLSRKARSYAAISGDSAEQANINQNLTQRQIEQQGRIVDHIDRAVGSPESYASEKTRLADSIKVDADAAYKEAYAEAKPVDLSSTLNTWRTTAAKSAGKIKDGLTDAIDLFYGTGINAREMNPNLAGRVLGRAYQRRVADPYGKFEGRTASPIQDLERFKQARDSLGDMISSAQRQGENNLARNLIQFKDAVNADVRARNPGLAKADKLFSEGRASQDILELGTDLPNRLGKKTSEVVGQFNSLTPKQQDLFRVGFGESLRNMVLNARQGSANAVKPLMGEGAQRIIRRVFPGERGETLVKAIRQELATTRTHQDITQGSRTAPLEADITANLEKARAMASTLTGKANLMAGHAVDVAARMAMGKRAGVGANLMTTTNPSEALSVLNSIATAKGAAARRVINPRTARYLTQAELAEVNKRKRKPRNTL